MTFLFAKYLPTEVQLDVFKFFNYNQLCSIKQTNLYFRNFVNEFEVKLAREKFDQIIIDYSYLQNSSSHYKLIKPNVENFDFALNEELEEKWKNGIKKPIPLYLASQYSNNNIVIWLYKEFISDGSKIKGLQLQLPTIIRSKNQIKIVYYYLNKLFNCSFDYGNFDDFTFNPELIQLLFGNSKQFYIRRSSVFLDYNIGNVLKFILNHLISETFEINLYDEDATKYTDILFKILMSGDKFNNVCLVSKKVQNLFDCIINHIETSKDCSKLVANIELQCCNIPFTFLNKRAKKIGKKLVIGTFVETKYQLSSKFNPKIKFSFLCEGNLEVFNNIEIERIYC
uniref:Uncharacterized protein n=1 Tax=Meloidogyne enterolobii TaxID=390850 RepID=A0A6V7U3Z6_MELEN|nr:unnamed protein product [Meloidogyne enterolobii]